MDEIVRLELDTKRLRQIWRVGKLNNLGGIAVFLLPVIISIMHWGRWGGWNYGLLALGPVAAFIYAMGSGKYYHARKLKSYATMAVHGDRLVFEGGPAPLVFLYPDVTTCYIQTNPSGILNTGHSEFLVIATKTVFLAISDYYFRDRAVAQSAFRQIQEMVNKQKNQPASES